MFETNAKGESEFWRVALFRCLEKAKTLLVLLPETVFALLLLFLTLGVPGDTNTSASQIFLPKKFRGKNKYEFCI